MWLMMRKKTVRELLEEFDLNLNLTDALLDLKFTIFIFSL